MDFPTNKNKYLWTCYKITYAQQRFTTGSLFYENKIKKYKL